ncbi:MAG: HNH endonuclease [Bacteroidia bacterium]|nr:HNH endonuclease [Bacteroidia bacterium]
MGPLSRSKVLVLNQDYQAIGICSAERAFVLVYLNKAELLKEHPSLRLRTPTSSYCYPSIIRLRRFISMPYKKVQLTRLNIFRRDNNRCLYCNSHKNLTIDHVVPKAMGGKDSWENLATACQTCNSKKGNRTPEEAEMPLRQIPFRPSFVMFLSNFSGNITEDWKPYLYMT